jgi:hypothetical protein
MDVRFEQQVNVKFKHNFTVLPHTPYSPDLSPCDFFSVSTTDIKMLKGRRHENIEAIHAAATMELTGIPKETFTSCFQDLQKRWQQCIDCGGNYFDGDRKHYLWGWILYFLQTQSQNFTDKGCMSVRQRRRPTQFLFVQSEGLLQKTPVTWVAQGY